MPLEILEIRQLLASTLPVSCEVFENESIEDSLSYFFGIDTESIASFIKESFYEISGINLAYDLYETASSHKASFVILSITIATGIIYGPRELEVFPWNWYNPLFRFAPLWTSQGWTLWKHLFSNPLGIEYQTPGALHPSILKYQEISAYFKIPHSFHENYSLGETVIKSLSSAKKTRFVATLLAHLKDHSATIDSKIQGLALNKKIPTTQKNLLDSAFSDAKTIWNNYQAALINSSASSHLSQGLLIAAAWLWQLPELHLQYSILKWAESRFYEFFQYLGKKIMEEPPPPYSGEEISLAYFPGKMEMVRQCNTILDTYHDKIPCYNGIHSQIQRLIATEEKKFKISTQWLDTINDWDGWSIHWHFENHYPHHLLLSSVQASLQEHLGKNKEEVSFGLKDAAPFTISPCNCREIWAIDHLASLRQWHGREEWHDFSDICFEFVEPQKLENFTRSYCLESLDFPFKEHYYKRKEPSFQGFEKNLANCNTQQAEASNKSIAFACYTPPEMAEQFSEQIWNQGLLKAQQMYLRNTHLNVHHLEPKPVLNKARIP